MGEGGWQISRAKSTQGQLHAMCDVTRHITAIRSVSFCLMTQCLLSAAHSPLIFSLCCAVLCDWPCLSLRAGSQRQVLSAAECCCVCGLQGPVLTFLRYLERGGKRRRPEHYTSRPHWRTTEGVSENQWPSTWQPCCDNLSGLPFLVSKRQPPSNTPHFLF